ncbi:MATE family efflux transporter [Clostridium sp. Marseille-P299]|uniref:MATE family efflux transporter n=1 Tax=Clostridium sp. Marseille-P299 TaxID=1805477 RepID=UPI00082B6CD6|nr:MATE family efflux transporter [Clostridium sp. Marseille-P299]
MGGRKVENDLGKDSVKRLVLRLAIPSMLAQFVSVLYSIVDRMYIGHMKEIGETALAGVGVTGPIVNLIASFAFWIGIGGAPLLSIRMGEKDEEGAKKILANCFIGIISIGIVLTIITLLLKNKMIMWFGASEETFVYAENYMSVYVLGTVFAFIAAGMNQFIICQGFAKIGMYSVIIGAVANIILDPIFIFAFGLGVKGAAIATVLSQALSALFILYILFGNRVPIKITFGGYSVKVLKQVLILGLAPFIILASDNVLIIVLNMVLQKYGGVQNGDMLVTCATIVQSFMLIITMPLGGITGGTQAILGYNYGAKQIDRIKQAQRYIALIAVIFTSVMMVIANTIPDIFVQMFTNNVEYMKYCRWAIKVYTLGIIPLALQYTIVDGFTGMGIVKMSLPLSLSRKFLFFVCVLVFPAVFGVDSAFYTEPVVDIVAGIVSTSIYLLFINRILNQRKIA